MQTMRTRMMTAMRAHVAPVVAAAAVARGQPQGIFPSGYPEVVGGARLNGYRSFVYQAERLWERKYDFTFAGRFDRITPSAVSACSGVARLVAGQKWNPTDPASGHSVCWRQHLNPTLRAHQILQATSAPGTSRHHWGTDFDMFSVEPDLWWRAHEGPLYPAYSWLTRNASRYGFVQPYSFSGSRSIDSQVVALDRPDAGYMYMEERWHWSFYPIAEALLQFVDRNREAVRARLVELWDERDRSRRGGPAYEFVRRHWESYVFTVNRTLRD
ncbi:D-alanyl-D-alanine carboxypeptidase family protein [Sorangium sp. So ce260]|uniref:D-alanyl-D-alanine carboxypeptidase family protein n=1 Tax=Sorangium sp. So ce260 TaxID=3133291 RepID=UPI003F641EB9